MLSGWWLVMFLLVVHLANLMPLFYEVIKYLFCEINHFKIMFSASSKFLVHLKYCVVIKTKKDLVPPGVSVWHPDGVFCGSARGDELHLAAFFQGGGFDFTVISAASVALAIWFWVVMSLRYHLIGTRNVNRVA